MKHLSAFFLFLLIVGVSLAVKPLLVGQSSVIVRINGTAVTPQRIYLPQTTEMQTASYPYSPKEDSYGNKYIVVKGKFDIQVKTVVDSSKLLILSDEPLGSKDNVSSEYLLPTVLINSNNPLIESVAHSIIKGSRTRLDAISKLMIWTNTHVTYDQKYAGVYLSGVETLKTGKGVCDEYTNLYASLARSVGIPTRIVIGLVYSGADWQLHAWAESYVSGTWIPVDPTFGEIGQIDATHIVLYRGPGYPFYVSPSNTLNYNVISQGFYNSTIPISVTISKTNMSLLPRQKFNITIHVSNNGNTYLTPTYMLQTTPGLQLISTHRQSTILPPMSSKNISWKLVAPYGERPVYYANIIGPGIDRLLTMTIKRAGHVNLSSGLAFSNVFAYSEGRNTTLVVSIKNVGNMDLGNVRVIAVMPGYGSFEKDVSVPVGSSVKLKFDLPEFSNVGDIYLKAISNNVSVSTYVPVFLQTKTKHEGPNPLVKFIRYLSSNTTRLFWMGFALIVFIAFLLVVSIHPPKKEPFREKKKWSKILKMDNSK